jgi:hypothetical protein
MQAVVVAGYYPLDPLLLDLVDLEVAEQGHWEMPVLPTEQTEEQIQAEAVVVHHLIALVQALVGTVVLA